MTVVNTMKWLFWASAFFVAYVYAGYPLLLAAWAGVARWRRERASNGRRARGGCPARTSAAGGRGDRDAWPPVSIVLAARNEAAALPGRLENLLSLDYPPERLEIVVVSDGSSDHTLSVLDSFAPDVRAVALPRIGKPGALNAGVAAARHAIVVFADARQRFARDAVQRLVERFADPRVGAVSGELVIDSERDRRAAESSPVGEGVGLYWRYEKWIRRRESDVSSAVGATGAIYAMRRELWRPLPLETLLDDVLAPMRVALAGYRVVFEPRAVAFDKASPDAATEKRRKVRTLAGNFQLVRLEPRLLWPPSNPLFVQFVSHKLGRLFVPYALVALLLSNMALASAGLVYGLALVAQVSFYVLALHGAAAALAVEDARRPGPAPAPTRPQRPAQHEQHEHAPARRRKELVNAETD